MTGQPKASGFQACGIELLSCEFRAHPESRAADGSFPAPEFNYEATGQIDTKSRQIVVVATLGTVAPKHGSVAFDLRLELVARFTWIGDTSMQAEEFARRNAAAFIWPYLREHVWSLSTRALGSPLMLPIVNLTEARILVKPVQPPVARRSSGKRASPTA